MSPFFPTSFSSYADLLSALLTFFIERFPPVRIAASKGKGNANTDTDTDGSNRREDGRGTSDSRGKRTIISSSTTTSSSSSSSSPGGNMQKMVRTPIVSAYSPKQGDTYNTLLLNSLGVNTSNHKDEPQDTSSSSSSSMQQCKVASPPPPGVASGE